MRVQRANAVLTALMDQGSASSGVLISERKDTHYITQLCPVPSLLTAHDTCMHFWHRRAPPLTHCEHQEKLLPRRDWMLPEMLCQSSSTQQGHNTELWALRLHQLPAALRVLGIAVRSDLRSLIDRFVAVEAGTKGGFPNQGADLAVSW